MSYIIIYCRLWSNRDFLVIRYYFCYKGKWYCYGDSKRVRIFNRVDIIKCFIVVDNKVCIGDWEVDIVWGKVGSGVIVILVDCKFKYIFIRKIKIKNVNNILKVIIDVFNKFKDRVKIIIYDNGFEFIKYEVIN